MLEVHCILDLEHTIAKDFFEGLTYPWEVFDGLGDKIIALGNSLSKDVYEEVAEHVWVAKSAKVAPTAFLGAPLIIDEDAEVRHCAFIRGEAVVGKGSVVGNSTELKSSILFDCVQTPHYNYVGNSILSYRSHMGAGSITSNLKSDKSLVTIKTPEGKIETGRYIRFRGRPYLYTRKDNTKDWAFSNCNNKQIVVINESEYRLHRLEAPR